MAKRALVQHPDGPKADYSVGCKISRFGSDALKLEYAVIGAVDKLRLPETVLPERIDGLWNSTCFEAFFAQMDGSYIEFNLSPSRAWASYRFEAYRGGMVPAFDIGTPELFAELGELRIALTAFLKFPSGELDQVRSVALSAIIEETDGTKSYWALAHPPGKPDFHHPACFTATLPAPSKP